MSCSRSSGRSRREGLSIIFITHKLNEVLEIADRVTVLRRGKLIETLPTAGATRGEPGAAHGRARCAASRRQDALRSRASRCSRWTGLTSATIAESRRCGASRSTCGAARSSAIAGVDGNGQSELIDAITGLRKIEVGPDQDLGATSSTRETAREHFEAGFGHIPEDRQHRGLVLDFSIAENIALHDFRKPPSSRFGWLYPKRLDRAGKAADQASSTSAAATRRRTRAQPLRRQPAEGDPRPRDRPGPEGADRRAADPRARRRCDRVRP